jgi:hypothetical protein
MRRVRLLVCLIRVSYAGPSFRVTGRLSSVVQLEEKMDIDAFFVHTANSEVFACN